MINGSGEPGFVSRLGGQELQGRVMQKWDFSPTPKKKKKLIRAIVTEILNRFITILTLFYYDDNNV